MADETGPHGEIEEHDWDSGMRLGFGAALGSSSEIDVSPSTATSRFHFDDEIARDATSVLVRGRDLEMDREVSLRILEAETDVPGFLERVQVGAQLQHPGIVPVYAFGLLEDGRAFVARRLVEGETFADLAARETGSHRLLAILEQAAHALAFAHARGVAHGHVTAERIVVGAHGEVLVTGWDRAVRANGSATPIRADVRTLEALLASLNGRGLPSGRAPARHAGEIARAIGEHLAEEEKRVREAEIGAAHEWLRAERERIREESAGRRARAAHQARRRTRTAFAAVVLAVLVGTIVAAWRHLESHAAAAETEAEVAAAMSEARLCEAGNDLASAQAWASTARARAREAGVPAAGAAEALWTRLESKRRAADRTDALLAALEVYYEDVMARWVMSETWKVPAANRDAVLDRWQRRNARRVDDGFAEIFRAHGVDPLATGPEAAISALATGGGIERFRPWLLRWNRWRGGAGRDAAILGLLDAAGMPTVSSLERYRGDYAACVEFSARDGVPETPALQLAQAAVALRPTSTDALHRLSLKLLLAGDHAAARAVADRFLELAPEDPHAYYMLSGTCEALGEPEEAVALARRAVDLEPGHVLFLYRLASSLYARESLEEAERVYRQVLEIEPEDYLAFFRIGVALEERGRHEQAVEALKRAVAIESESGVALTNLGCALLGTGKLKEAEAALRKATRVRPDLILGWANLGAVLLEAGELDEAHAAYRTALRLDPETARRHYALSFTHTARGEHEKAAASLGRAIDLDPDYVEAHVNLGAILLDRVSKIDAAIEHFEIAIRLDPELVIARVNMGNALRRKGVPRKALEAYRRALALDPDCAEAHGGQGAAWNDLGEPARALEAYRLALATEPEHVPSLCGLGVALLRQGDWRAALKPLRRARDLDPTRVEPIVSLGDAHLMGGNIGEAVRHYELAWTLPRTPSQTRDLHWKLGIAYCDHLRDYERAVREFEAALRLDPEHAALLNCLGSALWGKGEYEQGLDKYRRAFELDPDNAWNLSAYASILADGPDPELRDPDRAIQLALRALPRAPAMLRGKIANTIGAAHFRADRPAAAIRALLEGDPVEGVYAAERWLLLAMAHAKLGRLEDARAHLVRGSRWIAENPPTVKALLETRDEARALLLQLEELEKKKLVK